ncbi:hypothetical protein SlsnVgp043 [Spodoptera littoralis nucleopolyhedrovirus]|uniref:Uncharacterized protein n=1 Tax=Spodoptera littoralis nuclear polyhedrosis virus TaxID=10456 RepID=M1JNS6_NPVSL|nr:hypothetical protein SlsnVgp043 [Spodoptera littoralis nucleopolyhedrovirus]AGE89898.1 hypothetical protein SlsnVgp043 [Spodoptera littoralis nucleopolyhedrovirus]AYU75234.1 hypothetical protein [Spodoptera littoralis nucleopolyhedrovirus]
MADNTSSEADGVDIFERAKIKLMTYDQHERLNRYKFLYNKNGVYYYTNQFTNKVETFDRQILVKENLKDYLKIVY